MSHPTNRPQRKCIKYYYFKTMAEEGFGSRVPLYTQWPITENSQGMTKAECKEHAALRGLHAVFINIRSGDCEE